METEGTRKLAGPGRRESAADGRVQLDHKDAAQAALVRSSSRHHDTTTALGCRIKARLSWHRQSLPPSFFQSADLSLDPSAHLIEKSTLAAAAAAGQHYQDHQEHQDLYHHQRPQRQRAPSPSRRRSLLFGHSKRSWQEPEAAGSLASAQLQPLITSHTGRQPQPAGVTLADPATQSGSGGAGGQAHPAHTAGNTTAHAANIPTAVCHTTAPSGAAAAGPPPGIFGRLLRRASSLRRPRTPKPAKEPSSGYDVAVADQQRSPAQQAPDDSRAEPTSARVSVQEQRTSAPAQSPPSPNRPQTAFAADTLQAAAVAMPPAPLTRKPSLMDRLRLRSSSTLSPREQQQQQQQQKQQQQQQQQQQPPQQPVKKAAYVPTHAASDFSRLDPRVREGYQFYSRSSARHNRTLDDSAAHDQLTSQLRRLASFSSDIAEEEPSGDHSHAAASLPPSADATQPSQHRQRQGKPLALRVDSHEKQGSSPRDSKGPFPTSPVLESNPDEKLSFAARAGVVDAHAGGSHVIDSSATPTAKPEGGITGVTQDQPQRTADQTGEQQAPQLTDYELFVRRAAEREEQALRRRQLAAAQGLAGRVPAPQLPPPNPFYWQMAAPPPPPPRLGGIEEDQGAQSNSSAGGTTTVNPPRSSRSRSKRDSGHSYTLGAGGSAFQQQQQQQQQQSWQRHAKRPSWTSSAGRGASIEEEEGLVGARGVMATPALRRKPSITQRIAEYVRPAREPGARDEAARRPSSRTQARQQS
ncbi:hypothetical protein GGTG_03251 [Gaeumannomyces tritici R3-111a-1]|uniref:Uncharacterized protein n=1 Tax=Gaeumannomyces tritici (strain R3-111a-1) TaxID=644352 RepID=J3NPP4_GAET3|nr:hypothetical protein GGTG_03251 [Gaeumannomyces tritici R3-111a-1]EJT78149.1 hypothetical protein GGTG_03251 [Gaeumannomyces tritici R3-111a-1]